MTVEEVLHALIDAVTIAEDVRAKMHEAVGGTAPGETAPEGA